MPKLREDNPTQVEKTLEADLRLVMESPTRPVTDKTRYKMGGKSYEYYKSIPWPAWWDEFNSDVQDNGRRKYRTLSQFIHAKTKV